MIVKSVLLSASVFFATQLDAQQKGTHSEANAVLKDSSASKANIIKAKKEPISSFKELITEKAISQKGLITTHLVGDKYYFELPDSIFYKPLLAVTRISKSTAGAGFGGELTNLQTLQFEKAPGNKIFIRVVIDENVADSSQQVYRAVQNSNIAPIVAAFDIKAMPTDSTGTVIDVTDFFKSDNQIVSLHPRFKNTYKLNSLAADRSYIAHIQPFKNNIEISTVKTFVSPSSTTNAPLSGISLPAAEYAGVATFELHTSIIQLPKIPMKRRAYDPRVGYFSEKYEVYSDNQQKVQHDNFIVRWRLEPKPEDRSRYKQGELVEPQKQIVYYIDPATPKKWQPYFLAGIADWNQAFEQAGFKNAITGKVIDPHDSSVTENDARFSMIRYFASPIENAYGPNVHDPRSGEILESHIGWHHNIMKLMHDWYMIQAGNVDKGAQTMIFDDSLMGALLRFVVSHEVGHTLGLRHNMGSSSRTSINNLRNKKWVETNGHTASIMDYARFNYVAQPEDSIGRAGIFPRIGVYDKWAIQWGYRWIDETDMMADKKINNRWIVDSLKANPRLWFAAEGQLYEPRAQTEDLSNDVLMATHYGIKNLQQILLHLPTWTRQEADPYSSLEDMYKELMLQYNRYLFHLIKYIGGVANTPKTVEQTGDVFEPIPAIQQKRILEGLDAYLFKQPTWLLHADILNKIQNPALPLFLYDIQNNAMNALLNTQRLENLQSAAERFGTKTYTLQNYMNDLHGMIFLELKTLKPISIWRKRLQKSYIVNLLNIVKSSNTLGNGGSINKPSPISYIARGFIKKTQSILQKALLSYTNEEDRFYLEDLLATIKETLEK